MEPKLKESTPREILVKSTVDAMNRYVNQVLIPAKLIDEKIWKETPGGTGSDLCNKKYEIANDIGEKWEKALEARIARSANHQSHRTS